MRLNDSSGPKADRSFGRGSDPNIYRRQGFTMQINPYLSFKGDCEAAFKFSEQSLGAQVGPIYRYGGTPLADQVPANWSDKIMHGNLRFGDQVVRAGDVAPVRYE